MPFQPPPSVNYQSPLNFIPAFMRRPPAEGDQMIPCEIDWGTMGGANNSVHLNMANNATLAWSQICGLIVDNSQSGSDVTFFFPDTGVTTTIPAYSPYSIVEVATGAKELFVIADGPTVLSTDITRFTLLNFPPAPVSVSVSQEQNTSSTTGVDAGTASTTLVPSTVSGTLTSEEISIAVAASNTGNATWILEDGTGKVIDQGQLQISSGSKVNLVLSSRTGMNVRFSQGLKLLCTQSAVIGGTYSVNLLYRTP